MLWSTDWPQTGREAWRRNSGFYAAHDGHRGSPFTTSKRSKHWLNPLPPAALPGADGLWICEPQIHWFPDFLVRTMPCPGISLRVYPQAHTVHHPLLPLAVLTIRPMTPRPGAQATMGKCPRAADETEPSVAPHKTQALRLSAPGERRAENFVIQKIYTPRFKHLEGMTLRDAAIKWMAYRRHDNRGRDRR